MYPDRIAEIVHAVVPHVVDKLFLTDGTPPIEQQVFKYPDFLPCERQLLSVCRSGAGFGVKGKPAAGQNHIVLCELPSGKTADPCLQLL